MRGQRIGRGRRVEGDARDGGLLTRFVYLLAGTSPTQLGQGWGRGHALQALQQSMSTIQFHGLIEGSGSLDDWTCWSHWPRRVKVWWLRLRNRGHCGGNGLHDVGMHLPWLADGRYAGASDVLPVQASAR